MQITAIIYVTFISKASGICKRNYSFRMNIMEEIFDIKSCIEILANDIKIYIVYQYMYCSTVIEGIQMKPLNQYNK